MMDAERTRLLELGTLINQAEQKLYAAIEEILKPGSVHVYTHGNNFIEVEVVAVHCDRVRVRGNSGKEYWLSYYRFI